MVVYTVIAIYVTKSLLVKYSCIGNTLPSGDMVYTRRRISIADIIELSF